jgi:hypothetical protein
MSTATTAQAATRSDGLLVSGAAPVAGATRPAMGPRTRDRVRQVVRVTALLVAATAGFATARVLAISGAMEEGRVCSETCLVRSTTAALWPVIRDAGLGRRSGLGSNPAWSSGEGPR